MNAVELLETRRILASRHIDRAQRSALGQWFTPAPVARYMASLLRIPGSGRVHLLDPGAGIGLLTAAVAQQAHTRQFKVTCYELESRFQKDLRETLAKFSNITTQIEQRDFIEHTVQLITRGELPYFTHAILNPPYRKIASDSHHRLLVRQLGLETSNLYTCFLACTIAACTKGAQVVAIIPRSFMNGPYFKPFRRWLLARVAITHIHVFDSRDRAFSDDGVLQENVILRMRVGAKQESVAVSVSHDQNFTDTRFRQCLFSEVVMPGDTDNYIHVPAISARRTGGLVGSTLRELGLDVCTGPVVDFRVRDHLSMRPRRGAVPLLYASHFVDGHLVWPREARKPNAIVRNKVTEKWLMPMGCYVVIRRFTSKEERRRVVAYLLEGDALPYSMIGFENHLNVIHIERGGLPVDLACGIAAFLNSQQVDNYFRTFSGHTQVNATDLRRLRYPHYAKLEAMGRAARLAAGTSQLQSSGSKPFGHLQRTL